jgi:5-formyltetrahydrofolate cyclo-ligase
MKPDRPVPSKNEAREAFRLRRRRLEPAEREAASRRLAQTVLDRLPRLAGSPEAPLLIAAYLGVSPEPATEHLLAALKRAGHGVVVPVCEPEYALSWTAWWPGVPLVKSPRAPVFEPEGPRLPLAGLPTLDLVLVPGLAMDAAGNRLGQGGGYYDRFLAGLAAERPGVPTAGILYSHELVAEGSFPVEPLDVPLDGVFTPGSYHGFGAPPAPV